MSTTRLLTHDLPDTVHEQDIPLDAWLSAAKLLGRDGALPSAAELQDALNLPSERHGEYVRLRVMRSAAEGGDTAEAARPSGFPMEPRQDVWEVHVVDRPAAPADQEAKPADLLDWWSPHLS